MFRHLKPLLVTGCWIFACFACFAQPSADWATGLSGPLTPVTASGVPNPKVGMALAVQAANVPADSVSKLASSVLRGLKPEATRSLRGSKSVQLYRQVSPAVVLVATKDGLGTGSLLNNKGDIITNWHVVKGFDAVGVVFKPQQEGQRITKADVRRAIVVHVDEAADLALLRVEAVPPGISPVRLGNADVLMVGADVHAIGHPTGEAWTYTMGVVSQVRRDYTWTSDATGKAHKATVVQTQTPINPGNSGGPLLVDDGTLVGVNTFKSVGNDGLNFAVSVSEVRRFLAAGESRYAANVSSSPDKARGASGGASQCEPREVYSGLSADKSYNSVGIDLDCDGKADVEFRTPVDRSKAVAAVFDTNGDGRIDIVVFNPKRDYETWEFSFHDTDFDGEWDLVGYHPDGKIVATRFEPYKSAMAKGR